MIAAPALVRLSDSVEEALRHEGSAPDLAEVAKHIGPAATLHEEMWALHRVYAPAVERRPETVALLEEIDDLYGRQRQALADILDVTRGGNPSILQSASDRLTDSVQGLAEKLGLLVQAEASMKPQSPLPVFDQLIKVGNNVLAGAVDSVVLLMRFNELMASWRAIRAAAERFFALYEAPEGLRDAFDQSLETLETGLGALYEHFRTADREPLVEGLRLLRAGSTGAAAVLVRMDHLVASQVSGTTLMAADGASRALQGFQQGRVSREVLEGACLAARSLVELYVGHVEGAARFPRSRRSMSRFGASSQSQIRSLPGWRPTPQGRRPVGSSRPRCARSSSAPLVSRGCSRRSSRPLWAP